MTKEILNDPRHVALVRSVAAEALRQCGPVNPDKIARDTHDVALLAASMTVERIYSADSELAMLRKERDIYKNATLNISYSTPARLPVIPNVAKLEAVVAAARKYRDEFQKSQYGSKTTRDRWGIFAALDALDEGDAS